jgi:hypothetical protein
MKRISKQTAARRRYSDNFNLMGSLASLTEEEAREDPAYLRYAEWCRKNGMLVGTFKDWQHINTSISGNQYSWPMI